MRPEPSKSTDDSYDVCSGYDDDGKYYYLPSMPPLRPRADTEQEDRKKQLYAPFFCERILRRDKARKKKEEEDKKQQKLPNYETH